VLRLRFACRHSTPPFRVGLCHFVLVRQRVLVSFAGSSAVSWQAGTGPGRLLVINPALGVDFRRRPARTAPSRCVGLVPPDDAASDGSWKTYAAMDASNSHGTSKAALALDPPTSAWGRSMLAKRGGKAVQRRYRSEGRTGNHHPAQRAARISAGRRAWRKHEKEEAERRTLLGLPPKRRTKWLPVG